MAKSVGMTRMHEAIFHDLVHAIVWGELTVGDRIPYETDLAEKYGVSRTVARETIQRLRDSGLVVVRRRAGATVTSQDQWKMLEEVVLEERIRSAKDNSQLQSVFDARLIIEPEAARMAATRATTAQLERMRAALKTMQSSELPAFVESDVEFHMAILEAADNWILLQFAPVIRTVITSTVRITVPRIGSLERSARLHQDVLESIEHRLPDRAAVAMKWLIMLSLEIAEDSVPAVPQL